MSHRPETCDVHSEEGMDIFALLAEFDQLQEASRHDKGLMRVADALETAIYP
jgi:hypothetical protein